MSVLNQEPVPDGLTLFEIIMGLLGTLGLAVCYVLTVIGWYLLQAPQTVRLHSLTHLPGSRL